MNPGEIFLHLMTLPWVIDSSLFYTKITIDKVLGHLIYIYCLNRKKQLGRRYTMLAYIWRLQMLGEILVKMLYSRVGITSICYFVLWFSCFSPLFLWNNMFTIILFHCDIFCLFLWIVLLLCYNSPVECYILLNRRLT